MNTHNITSHALNRNIAKRNIASVESRGLILRKVEATNETAGRRLQKPSAWVRSVQTLIGWFVWLAQTSIIRSVAPGTRSLERHEFESVETRRGGFGNVF